MTYKTAERDAIPGTIIFDSRQAMKSYGLNKMCFSFNSVENREAYFHDQDGYSAKFNITEEQRQALKKRDVLKLLELGANIYGSIRLSPQILGRWVRPPRVL